MEIEVRFYAHLVQYLPPKATENRVIVSLKPGSSLRDLMEQLGLPEEIAHSTLILVNEVHSNQNQILKEGDRVYVLPPIAGGLSAYPESRGGSQPRASHSKMPVTLWVLRWLLRIGA